MTNTFVACMKTENDVVHRSFQDYVIEVLEHLEEECIIDGEDKSYIKAKKEVERCFGPLQRQAPSRSGCVQSKSQSSGRRMSLSTLLS